MKDVEDGTCLDLLLREADACAQGLPHSTLWEFLDCTKQSGRVLGSQGPVHQAWL